MGSILHLFAGYGYGMPSRNRRPLPGRLRHAFGQETPTGLGAVWCRCRAATAEVAAMAPELSSGQATWARSWLNFVLSCDLYCKQKMWLFFLVLHYTKLYTYYYILLLICYFMLLYIYIYIYANYMLLYAIIYAILYAIICYYMLLYAIICYYMLLYA